MTHLPTRVSKPGPIITYLMHLQGSGNDELKAKAQMARAAVQAVLSTDEGRILMELLEKSTIGYTLSPDADDRALAALNAQRFIALDLRRIASDEIEAVLDENPVVGRGGRRGASR